MVACIGPCVVYTGVYLKVSVQIVLLMTIIAILSCGPLPRPGSFGGNLAILPTSAEVTGVVLTATDDAYSSTDVYFYNFGTGQWSPLGTGESGDVLVRWDANKLWLFNRAQGRVSFSSFSPKVGPTSRSSERRTPSASAFDPFDFTSIGHSEGIISLQAAKKVAVINLVTGAAVQEDLTSVDTGDLSIPFRPGLIRMVDDRLLVFHQALDNQWQATSGGRIFFGRRNNSSLWSWVDQDITASGIQGMKLHISNPVAVFDCQNSGCVVAGACYDGMGAACVSGVDQLNFENGSIVHAIDWPVGAISAGAITRGITAGQVLACLKLSNESTAKLVLMELKDSVILGTWDSRSAYCGDFKVDRSGERVFVIQAVGSVSHLLILDNQLKESARIPLGLKISGIEVVNE